MNPEEDILPEITVSRNVEEDTEDVVAIVKEPVELRSLSTGFYTIYKGTKYYTRINLPLPHQQADEFFTRLKGFQGSGYKVAVAHLLENADFLTNEELADKLWKDLEYYGQQQEEK